MQQCRVAATSLLRSVASASKAARDQALFGDSARDAMLATKDVVALTTERVTNPVVDVAGTNAAANSVRESVIAFVRVARSALSEGEALSPQHEQLAPCVRAVALGTKAWLELVAPVPTSAPVQAPAAATAVADEDDEDSEEADRRVAEKNRALDAASRSSPSPNAASPSLQARGPPVTRTLQQGGSAAQPASGSDVVTNGTTRGAHQKWAGAAEASRQS
jgi:hypothetical protein